MTIKITASLLLFFVILQCAGNVTVDSTKNANENPRKKRDKSIHFNYLKGVTTLFMDPPGPRINRTMVLGIHKIEDEGFRFTPLTEAPERLPQKNFDRHFWYNSLIKELYIPYTEMVSVKTRGLLVIKTTNGKKYKIHMKGYKSIAAKLRKNLN
jgi:hypothetical protein